jgi:glucosylceramidase
MIMRQSFILLLPLFLLFTGCNEDPDGMVAPPPSDEDATIVGEARVWTTLGNRSQLLGERVVDVLEGEETENPSISIDFSDKMQEIEGFGAALTGSSAYLINRKMDAFQQRDLLEHLFDPDKGIGISYIRLTMGASDFSLSDYTYNDLSAGATDRDLSQFSIRGDKEDVIPVLKAILAVAPDISIMASPWSAPAWMKTSQSLNGGSLKPEWYDTYALYFVKYIKAMAAEGISIDAITIQNEPLHESGSYPTMRMAAMAQAEFIKNHLGPLFKQEDIETRIIIYDHNWDQPGYPVSILDDAAVRSYVYGTAFHGYGGNVSAMSQVHAAYPEKGLYFTEISGGGWATDFSDNLMWNVSNIFIETVTNWSKNTLLWNLALDQDDGPQNGGCTDCRGVVTILPDGGFESNVEYYATAHMSKFVRPGARRVSSCTFDNSTGLKNVAFINDNGAKVVVVINNGTDKQDFTLIDGSNRIEASLQAMAVATIVWE